MAQFTAAEASFVEENIQVTLWVSISEPVGFFTSVLYETVDSSATAGFDFQGQNGSVVYQAGESVDKPIYVTLFDDDLQEGPETFMVRLEKSPSSPIEVGVPSEVQITILDSDEGPGAYFVVGEDIPLNDQGALVLFGPDGRPFEITIELVEFPTDPVTIHYMLESDPTPIPLVFDNVRQRTVTIDAPTIQPGEMSASELISLVTPAAAQGKNGSVYVAIDSWAPLIACFGCFVAELFGNHVSAHCRELKQQLAGFAGFDGFEQDLSALAHYRDEILAVTQAGQAHIELYERLSEDLAWATLERPTFAYQVKKVWDRWIPGIGALVNGDGDSFVITEGMQLLLQGAADVFIEEGSAQLVNALTQLRNQIDLDSIAGLTMKQFQARIEASGLPTDWESWGTLKSRFRADR